jgi:hypothetical protein
MSGLAHSMALVASGALFGASIMGIAMTLVIQRQRQRLAAAVAGASKAADLAKTRISCRDTMIRIMDHIAEEQAAALSRANELLRTPHHIGWHEAVAGWRAGDAVRRAVNPPGAPQ